MNSVEIIQALLKEKENGFEIKYDLPEGLGEVIEADQYGGEGQGDKWYRVLHFVDHDIYIKFPGWYSSYEGSYCDISDGIQVVPKEKTITVYE